ncbi:unnamed protein product [Ectocarpus sp. CCAP 1310/34]|nr:unnamed protein product [Ectocarpus sp. CCAP 1310/34]
MIHVVLGRIDPQPSKMQGRRPFTVEFAISTKLNILLIVPIFSGNSSQATDDGSALIIVNSESQQLFAVDPDTGAATLIEASLFLEEAMDWCLLDAARILEVPLAANLSCGSLAPRALSNPLLDTQTTSMRKGNSLYAVNANFGVAAEDVATTAYKIVRVDQDSGESWRANCTLQERSLAVS